MCLYGYGNDGEYRRVCAETVKELRIGLRMAAEQDSLKSLYIHKLERDNEDLCNLYELEKEDNQNLKILLNYCHEDVLEEAKKGKRKAVKAGILGGTTGFSIATIVATIKFFIQ